jgi:hypothetical protein
LEEAQRAIADSERRVQTERKRIDVAALDGALVPDSVTAAKVQALTNLQAQKTRSLMKTINMQKEQITKLQRSGKEHKRSKMVQRQDRKLKEMELAVDVMKTEVVKRELYEPTDEKVNDWLTKKTTGGPLRFRPKAREELQNEILHLQQRNRQLEARLEKAKSSMTRPQPVAAWADDEPHPSLKGAGGDGGLGETGGGGDADRVRELLEQVQLLNVAVASRDLNLRSHLDEMERLHGELREMRVFEDQHQRLERKYRQHKVRMLEMEEEATQSREQRETAVVERDIARKELRAFKAEVGRDVDAQEQQLVEEREQNARLTDDCFELKRQLAEATKRVSARREEQAGKSRSDVRREREAKQTVDSLRRKEGSMERLEERVEVQQEELQLLREANAKLVAAHAAGEARLEEREQQVELARRESQESKVQQIGDRKEQGLQAAQQGGTTMHREQVEKLETKVEQYENELAKADTEIEQLEELTEQLQGQVAALRERAEKAEEGGGGGGRGREQQARAEAHQQAEARNKLVLHVRDLEEQLVDMEEARDRAEDSIRKLKAQNEQLIRWKAETHRELIEEKRLLQQKLSAATLLRRHDSRQ